MQNVPPEAGSNGKVIVITSGVSHSKSVTPSIICSLASASYGVWSNDTV
jgi:hypothetical protein